MAYASGGSALTPPTAAVPAASRPQHECRGDVLGGDHLGTPVQIGDRASDPTDAVVAATREPVGLQLGTQQSLAVLGDRCVPVEIVAGERLAIRN